MVLVNNSIELVVVKLGICSELLTLRFRTMCRDRQQIACTYNITWDNCYSQRIGFADITVG
jgi:hypothetical protein